MLLSAACRWFQCQSTSDSGVPIDDPTLPMHQLRDSVLNFIHAGQPRTLFKEGWNDPLGDVIFACDEKVSVQSKDCKGPCQKVDKACSACVKLCRRKNFRACIASKSYLIDLARYAHKLFHASAEEVQILVEEITSRDYRLLELAGNDFEAICAMPSKVSQVAKIRSHWEHIPAWRFSDAMQAFKQHWLPKTDLYHSTDIQAQAHASLVASLGQSVAQGTVRQLDLSLASKIAAGALRCDSLVDGLITTFLQTLDSSLRNKRRRASGQWIDAEALMDAAHTLGRGPEAASLLFRFRVNSKLLPKLSFNCSALPDSFVSIRDREILKQSYQKIQCLLKAPSGRLHLVVDETTWSPSYQQARQFRDGEDRILGGAWDVEASNDWSCLAPEKHSLASLPKQHMAKTALHVVAHRVDCTRFVFELCCLPTRTVLGTSDVMFTLLSQVLDAATEVSDGRAPSGIAFDGATVNSKLLRFFVGLLPAEEWESLPFFQHCRINYPKFKYWPFGHVLHKDDLMVSFHGAWHLQKRYSLQFMSSARKVRFADLFTDLSSMLHEKLPVRAYMCTDVQSDKQAIMRLSVPFLTRSWSGLGQIAYALVAALLASGTTASPGFSKRETAANAFSAFYLLLLHVVYNDQSKRDGTESIHITTLRNATALASCIITACMTSVEHRHIQEKTVEEHFSRIKSAYRGHPSVRDGQFGVLCTHAKQAKRLERETPETLGSSSSCQSREALTHEDLVKIAQTALATSVQFFCMLCAEETGDELVWKLIKWWKERGDSFFRKIVPPEDEEDALKEAENDVHEDLDQDEAPQVQAQNFNLLKTVQDRAMVWEELCDLLQDGGDGKKSGPAERQEEEVEAKLSAHEAADLIPLEGEMGEVPKTLHQVVQKAIKKPEYSKYAVGESAGEYSCLKRAHLLLGPARQLIRLVRLEEGVLSVLS